MKILASILAVTAIATAAPSGCATTETFQGAALGCGVGAVAQLLQGQDSTKDLLEGCAVGAVVGGVAGEYIKRERQKFDTAEAFYDSEIQKTQQANFELSEDIYATNQQVDMALTDLAALEAEVEAGRAEQTELAARVAELNAQVETNNKKLADAEETLEIKEAVYAEIAKSEDAANIERAAAMKAEVDTLRISVAQLRQSNTALATAVAQRADLG